MTGQCILKSLHVNSITSLPSCDCNCSQWCKVAEDEQRKCKQLICSELVLENKVLERNSTS